MSYGSWCADRACVLLASVILFTPLVVPAEAATIRYHTDAELIQQSARVVRGRVLDISSERSGSTGWIHTITRLAVLEDFTGLTGPVLTIQELGGIVDGETLVIGGAVTYPPGREVVVCLEALPGGRYRSVAMGLSKFDLAPAADGDALLSRNLGESIVVGSAVAVNTRLRLSEFRRLARAVRGIRSVRPLGADALVADQSTATEMSFALLGGGVRWVEVDSGSPIRWYRSTAAPAPLFSGDGTPEIQTALAAWTAPSSAAIVLQYGGTTTENDPYATSTGGIGVIFFEDPYRELTGSVLAIGGGFTDAGGGTVNGRVFDRFTRAFVIFQNAAELSASFRESLNFSRVLEHEIGHGIGRGHSGAPDSIMYASCCTNATPIPPALGADDLAGLNFIYPCSYSLSQNSASLAGGGGAVGVSVTTTASCPWNVSALPAWISATPAGGTGPNPVLLSIRPNVIGAPSRSAQIAIAGVAFTVEQDACTTSISPAALWLPASGTTRHIQIASGGCAWTAFSSAAWTAITPASGTADGVATVVVSANASAATRSATVTLGGLSVPLVQGGRAVAADFNFDGRSDLIWQHDDGRISTWAMNGTQMISGALIVPGSVADTDWRVAGTWDPNGDGSTDVLWRHRTAGWLANWTMSGGELVSGDYLSPSRVADMNWAIVGTGDFDLDGHPDLVWQHTDGWISVWLMNGTTLVEGRLLSPGRVDSHWKIVGIGDFNGDGQADIVWQHDTTGEAAVWFMTGTTRVSGTLLSPPGVRDTSWKIRAVTDLNGDGQPDLVWQNTMTGYLAAWLMNGLQMIDGVYLSPSRVADTAWHLVGPR